MDLFGGRVLLTPELAETLLERLVLVAIRADANENSVSFTVFAPGMTESDHSSLRRGLNICLSKTLNQIHPEWIFSVEVEPDGLSGDTETFVTVANPHLVGRKIEEIVVKIIEAELIMRADRLGWQAIVLGAKQMLVPLNFKIIGGGDTYLVVKLPRDLLFVDACGCMFSTANPHHTPVTDELRRVLGSLLRAKSCEWRRLSVSSSRDGVMLRLFFEDFDPPEQPELDDIAASVTHVLEAYARYPSSDDRLVFRPVYLPTNEESAKNNNP